MTQHMPAIDGLRVSWLHAIQCVNTYTTSIKIHVNGLRSANTMLRDLPSFVRFGAHTAKPCPSSTYGSRHYGAGARGPNKRTTEHKTTNDS